MFTLIKILQKLVQFPLRLRLFFFFFFFFWSKNMLLNLLSPKSMLLYFLLLFQGFLWLLFKKSKKKIQFLGSVFKNSWVYVFYCCFQFNYKRILLTGLAKGKNKPPPTQLFCHLRFFFFQILLNLWAFPSFFFVFQIFNDFCFTFLWMNFYRNAHTHTHKQDFYNDFVSCVVNKICLQKKMLYWTP